jgi:hypothetical protein
MQKHEDNHDELFYPNGDPEKFHIIEFDRFAQNPEALYTVRGTARRKLAPSLYRWLRFFKCGDEENFMEKYKETDVAIKEAKADYENFLTDAQLREAQFEHEMFLHDQAQAKSDAHKEGYEEGMEQGIATGIEQGIATGMEQGIATGTERGEHAKAVAVAKSMKALGMAADVIEKVSGLTADEISKL